MLSGIYRAAFLFNRKMKRIAIQGIKGCFHEQALAAVKPLMTDLNILGEYEAAI